MGEFVTLRSNPYNVEYRVDRANLLTLFPESLFAKALEQPKSSQLINLLWILLPYLS